KVPSELVGGWNAIASASYDAWTRALPANDFVAMRPYLEKLLTISREYSALFKPRHVADPLIDDRDEGMTCATVRALFAALRRELLPIGNNVCAQPPADDSRLLVAFAEAPQIVYGVATVCPFA